MVGTGARLIPQHHFMLPEGLIGVEILIWVVLKLLMLEGREDLLEGGVKPGLIRWNNLLR